MRNSKPFSLSGRTAYRFRNIAGFTWATVKIPVRRLFKGPQVPGWTLSFEMANYILRAQSLYSFDLKDVRDGREYLDSLVFYSPALDKVKTKIVSDPVKGIWFSPSNAANKKVILYFHGGGYAYFAKLHYGFIANIAKATNIQIFAPDYPLIPEHPYPAQLEYAMRTYKWLQQGNSPNNIVFMGDSAGGNLCLALLLKLRETGAPMPSVAVALCPWTDAGNSGASMINNESYDWVEKRMADTWAKWFLAGRSHQDPLISPINADLRNLPPIYVQAGGKEILLDMIKDFYNRAISQGINIKMDVWDSMNHDFQAYGEIVPESREALNRISKFINGDSK
jgi:acetyl esterase/lipase